MINGNVACLICCVVFCQLHYTFQKMLLLQEPLLVVGAFYLLFLAVIVYVRMDFSITKVKHSTQPSLRSTPNSESYLWWQKCDGRTEICCRVSHLFLKLLRLYTVVKGTTVVGGIKFYLLTLKKKLLVLAFKRFFFKQWVKITYFRSCSWFWKFWYFHTLFM